MLGFVLEVKIGVLDCSSTLLVLCFAKDLCHGILVLVGNLGFLFHNTARFHSLNIKLKLIISKYGAGVGLVLLSLQVSIKLKVTTQKRQDFQESLKKKKGHRDNYFNDL